MALARLRAFIRLTRPLFLLGGVLAYGLGVGFARLSGAEIDLGLALLGQLLVTTTQLVAQYANEYYDIEVDAQNAQRTPFSGGSGVVASGRLGAHTVRRAALICAGVSLVCIAIVAARVPLAGLIGIMALLGAWFYSAPPLSLMGSGLGELEASIIVTLLTPLLAVVVQTGEMAWGFVAWVGPPLLALHTAMLLAFELPDRAADAAAGKKTLTVRLGARRVVWLHNALILFALGVLLALRLWPPMRFMWLIVPLAAWQLIYAHRSASGRPVNWVNLTFGALALFALATGLMVAGILTA